MTKRHLYGRNIILILAASFFYIASAMFINPLITGFAKGIGGSTLMAGIVAGIMNITSLFLRPISGQLTDKFSKKRLASVGGLGLLIATIGYTVVNNTAWLLFFFGSSTVSGTSSVPFVWQLGWPVCCPVIRLAPDGHLWSDERVRHGHRPSIEHCVVPATRLPKSVYCGRSVQRFDDSPSATRRGSRCPAGPAKKPVSRHISCESFNLKCFRSQ